jgi:2-methylcitrate dehydratase PrpD
VGPFGAAAAAARLYHRLRPLDVGAALAIASSHAAGVLEYTQSGGTVKRLHCAIPAQAGVRSAILADAGVTGPLLPLEGSRGFCRVFSDTPRAEELSRDLGDEFLLLETAIKTYCCCAMIHPALYAAGRLRAETGIRPDHITAIELYTPSQSILQHIGVIKHPRDVVSAQFSLSFSLAMLLSGWQCSWADYHCVPLDDPGLNALAAKVSLTLSGPDAGFVTGFRGVVRLADGRTLPLRADHSPGEPQLPVGHAGVQAKVLELTTPVIGEPQARELLQVIDSLEDIPTVRLLAESLRLPAVAAQH